MRFVVINKSKVIAVGHFADEIMDCARRMAGSAAAAFTPTGEMISFDGTPTGYRIMKIETETTA